MDQLFKSKDQSINVVSNQSSKLQVLILGHFSSGKSGTVCCPVKQQIYKKLQKSLMSNIHQCSSSVHLRVDGMRQLAKRSRTNARCLHGGLPSIRWFLSPLRIIEFYLIFVLIHLFSIKQSKAHPSLATNFSLLLLHGA